jgi:protein-S-isoprenylcysteine O-methyltransferase Ste14
MVEKIEKNYKGENNSETKSLILQATGKFTFIFILLGLSFFLPAGTMLFWEAWLFLGIFSFMLLFFLRFTVKNDPDLLRRRLQTGEKRQEQKIIKTISNIVLLIIFLLPGLDRRWNWSSVPIWLVFVSDVIFALGYMMFFRVLKENSFASVTVQVEQKVQKVITTGPYSYVRHPMYTAILLMMGIIPLALGSYWGLIPLPLLILSILLRIRDEEKMLCEELEGYKDYMQRTKYRIIPFIW